jgi:hypothetical protein
MVKSFHKPKKWLGGEVPHWEKQRFVLQEGARDKRSEEISKMREYYQRLGQRMPLTKEQKQAGARRII